MLSKCLNNLPSPLINVFSFSPVINLAASLGHGPYALGYQTAFDSGKSALTKHNLALNYNAGDMILHATSSDFKVRFGHFIAFSTRV